MEQRHCANPSALIPKPITPLADSINSFLDTNDRIHYRRCCQKSFSRRMKRGWNMMAEPKSRSRASESAVRDGEQFKEGSFRDENEGEEDLHQSQNKPAEEEGSSGNDARLPEEGMLLQVDQQAEMKAENGGLIEVESDADQTGSFCDSNLRLKPWNGILVAFDLSPTVPNHENQDPDDVSTQHLDSSQDVKITMPKDVDNPTNCKPSRPSMFRSWVNWIPSCLFARRHVNVPSSAETTKDTQLPTLPNGHISSESSDIQNSEEGQQFATSEASNRSETRNGNNDDDDSGSRTNNNQSDPGRTSSKSLNVRIFEVTVPAVFNLIAYNSNDSVMVCFCAASVGIAFFGSFFAMLAPGKKIRTNVLSKIGAVGLGCAVSIALVMTALKDINLYVKVGAASFLCLVSAVMGVMAKLQ